MGLSHAEHTESIAATPQACFDALWDFAAYPDWQSAVRSVEIVEDGDDPVVAFVVDAKIRSVAYTLRYHGEAPGRLWWEYVEGDVKAIEGEFLLVDDGDGGTDATYKLGLDPGRFVPGPVKRTLVEVMLRGSVKDLKARAEGG